MKKNLLILGLILLINSAGSYAQNQIINNGNIRFGTGSEASVTNTGNVKQPFYYNYDQGAWRQLTYSNYPLDYSFAVGGAGTDEWNLNGTRVDNPVMASQTFDATSFIYTSGNTGYGVLKVKGNISIGGILIEVENSYSLSADKKFTEVTTKVKNISGGSITNLRFWVGTRDDYVGATDQPRKQKGNLVDGSFIQNTTVSQRGAAILISTTTEGVLFYTTSERGNTIIQGCCSWTNVINQNPSTSTFDVTGDGSYGFYVRMNDLLNNETDEFTWYYAAGPVAELEDIIADVAAASSSVINITDQSATLNAKASMTGTGYYIVVARNAQAPTASQIKSAAGYDGVTVVASGSGPVTMNVERGFSITGLSPETDYDAYFVAENSVPEFSTITKSQFRTLATQTITFNPMSPVTYGVSPFSPGATASSGLTVSYSSSNTSVATVSGSNLIIIGTGTTTITASQPGNDQYVAAVSVEKTLTVNKKLLTVTADAKQRMYGYDNPSLTFQYSGFAGSENETVLDTKPVATTSVTVNSAVGVYTDAITISGGDDNNYTFSYTPADFTVTKATLTVTADAKEKVYGETNPPLTFSYSGFRLGQGEADLETAPIVSTSVMTNSNTGLYSNGITISGGADESYEFSYTPADFNITKAMLTVTADSKTKVYGSALPLLTFQYAGWVLSQDETVLDTKPVAATTVTENSVTGTYSDAITLAGGADNNYDFTYIAADFEVTKALLNVTAEDKEKIYGAPNPTLTFLYSGWVLGENESVLDTKPVAATTVTTATNAGIYSDVITVAGGADNNYDFTYTPADFTVTKATLTVTANDKEKVYGSVNPALTFQYSGWVLGEDESVLDTKPVAATTISDNSVAGLHTGVITVDGGIDNNYQFSYVPADFNITKAMLTVTADSKTKVYGSALPALTFQYAGWVLSQDESVLDTKPVAATTVTENSVTGTYTDAITVAGGVDDNYNFTYAANDFVVTKAMLNVTAEDKEKIYGAANPALTFLYSGWVLGEDESVLDTKPVAATTVTTATNAGIYSDVITVAGGADNNYDFTYTPADFTVNKATLTVTADDKEKVYGSVNPALTFQYSGFVAGEDETVLDTKPVAATTISDNSVAGLHTGVITVDGGIDNNYQFSYVPADFNITKAMLTVTADSKTKVYGSALPALTFQYAGWVLSQDESVLDTKPIAATTVTVNSVTGTYTDAITVAGGVDDNYNFTYAANDFVVIKAMLNVTAEDKEKIYGAANPALTFLYSGWVLGEDESVLDTKPVAATTVTTATDAGIYTADITVAAGADNNYDFTYTPADFTVNKATLTVTADDKEKVYGSVNPALTFQYSGFVAGEDETVLDTEPVAATTISDNSVAGLHTGTITVDGGVDNNYQFSYVPADFNITKAMLTVTADSKTKVYGSALPALTFQFAGWVLSQDETVLDTKPVAATTVTENSVTGTYTDAITVAGGVDDNYNFTYAANDFVVTKAMLNVTAEDKEKIYGAPNPTLTFLYSGWVLGEDESVLDTKPVAATTVTASTDAGVYTADITVAGGADNNYDFTYTPADFTVNKATLTVTADDKEKVYGFANPALTFSYSGFVLDNDQTVIQTEPTIKTDAGQNSNTGDYDIYFTGGADENYSFSFVSGTLTIIKADQTIIFQPVSQGLRITEEEALIATSTSGLTVEFDLLTPETGSLSGNYITIIREGTLTLMASQSGDHNWNTAQTVTQSVTTLPTFDNITSLFTPNNDGMNDYWYLPGLFEMGRVHVKIYNRFGKIVYESASYENNWDGTWNGKPLPAGSYYYLINSSVRGLIKGTVNIVR